MKVVVAQSAGFCWGVKRAVEKARHLANTRSCRVYTDGPLIHNEEMLSALRAEGIEETGAPETLTSGVLIVRAHGIAPERRRQLKALPVQLADATCRDVARIQGLIKQHAAHGAHTIIYGDPGHAEVVGLLGYADGCGHVVTNEAEVKGLPPLTQVCVVAQSTQFPDDYARISAAIRARFPDAQVFDTICAATKNRQSELQALAAEVDAVVVVGGKQSANTLRLVELARRSKPTFHVQNQQQLDPVQLRRYRSVGLTAGASTPDFIIAAVRQALEAL